MCVCVCNATEEGVYGLCERCSDCVPRRLNLESKLHTLFLSFYFVLLHTNCCIACTRAIDEEEEDYDGEEAKEIISKFQRHCYSPYQAKSR